MLYYKINYMAGGISTFVITLMLGLLIFIRGRGGAIVRSYFMLMLAVAAWSLGIFMVIASGTLKSSLFWNWFLHIGALFIPVFYFRFVIRLINLEKKQKVFIRTGYIIAAVFSLLIFTPYFVKSISYKLGINFPDPGSLYPLFILYFLSYPAYAHYLSYKLYDKLTDLGKRQLRYTSIAAVFGFLGGSLTFFTAYNIRVPFIGPLAIYLVTVGNFFAAAGTYTTRLMSLEFIRRRALIFSLLYGATVGGFVALVFIGREVLASRFNINPWVLPIAALFIITVFIRPLENLLARLTDRVLYQRHYDYMATLKSIAKGMTLITDTRRLLKLMVYFISKELRVTGCAIYIFARAANSYIREVNRGFKGQDIIDRVDKESPFIEWLIEKKQPLSNENVLSWIQGERIFPQRLILKRTLDRIRIAMKNLGGALCIPSFLRGEMIGFLVLGPKLSGDSYGMDDMSLLSTLANNAAIALENAHMYEELKERVKKLNHLYKEEHSLFIDAASAFSYAIDAKDGYAHTHALKVSDYTIAITKELQKLLPHVNFNDGFYEALKITSLLHDVGKIGVPDKILKKERNLTQEEQSQLNRHALIGETILHPIKEIEEVFSPIRHHHENFDGTGYPDGLRGNQIPMVSRVIAVADAYDTMTSGRPYHQAVSKEEAIKAIKEKAGTQFDPIVVEAFLKAVDSF